MKIAFLIVALVSINLSANASEEAGWFSPSCLTCAKMQTPGTANLGNSKGVFRPGGKKSKKKSEVVPPVQVDQ